MKLRSFVGMSLLAMATGSAAGDLRILCTTFPMFHITRNVVHGRDGTAVELLLPASLGCPHHYSLTPQDLRKLERADVLVVNGLGMEEFLGAPVKNVNPRLAVIDSSEGIANLLPYEAQTEHEHGDHEGHPPSHEGEHNEHEHKHLAKVNPHLFVSPRQTATLALNIAEGLSRHDPEGAPIYRANAAAYAGRMNALADEMFALVKTLQNNRIVEPHGVFDYLARDIGLEIVAVTQPHGHEPSASEMLELARTIREKGAGAVFTEPQYSPKVGQTLASETGVPVAVLDPVATGPEDAPLDYYEMVMRRNMDTLRSTLGATP